MNKFLIAGLGNPGEEYRETRHNIGFLIAERVAEKIQTAGELPKFSSDRYAHVLQGKYRGKQLVIIKPVTYMNLSGKAVSYWLQAEKIPVENLLVITDDIALPFGTLRLKKKGSPGGHNGLGDIAETLNTTDYPRLRFGVGSDFPKGRQSEYVLGPFNAEEQSALPEIISKAADMVLSSIAIGIDRTMSLFNNK